MWGRHKRDYVGIGEVNPSVSRLADRCQQVEPFCVPSFLPPSKRGSTVFQQVVLELCLGTHARETIRAPTRAEGNQAANTKRRKKIDNLKPNRSAEHHHQPFPPPLPPTTFYATHILGNLKPSRSCLFFTQISRVGGDLTRLQKTKKRPPTIQVRSSHAQLQILFSTSHQPYKHVPSAPSVRRLLFPPPRRVSVCITRRHPRKPPRVKEANGFRDIPERGQPVRLHVVTSGTAPIQDLLC